MFVRARLLAASLIWPSVVCAQTANSHHGRKDTALTGERPHRSPRHRIEAAMAAWRGARQQQPRAVVDLATGKVLRRITGLSEPQVVAYVPFSDSLFAANAG